MYISLLSIYEISNISDKSKMSRFPNMFGLFSAINISLIYGYIYEKKT